MKGIVFRTIIIVAVSLLLCSCALLKDTLDKRSGFSLCLKQTEQNIQQENWSKATAGLRDTEKTWKSVKPLLQIDIDHDYVNDIEDQLIVLNVYLENKEKADSLAAIRLIQKNWEKIGEM